MKEKDPELPRDSEHPPTGGISTRTSPTPLPERNLSSPGSARQGSSPFLRIPRCPGIQELHAGAAPAPGGRCGSCSPMTPAPVPARGSAHKARIDARSCPGRPHPAFVWEEGHSGPRIPPAFSSSARGSRCGSTEGFLTPSRAGPPRGPARRSSPTPGSGRCSPHNSRRIDPE